MVVHTYVGGQFSSALKASTWSLFTAKSASRRSQKQQSFATWTQSSSTVQWRNERVSSSGTFWLSGLYGSRGSPLKGTQPVATNARVMTQKQHRFDFIMMTTDYRLGAEYVHIMSRVSSVMRVAILYLKPASDIQWED